MKPLRLGLPARLPDGQGGVLQWLLLQMTGADGAFANSIVEIEQSHRGLLEVTTGDRSEQIAIADQGANDSGMVTVAPGVSLVPPDSAMLRHFLASHWRSMNHVGLNIAQHDLGAAEWQALIRDIALAVPAYRLDVGSANDIVMLIDDTQPDRPAVVELVYDRVAPCTSLHICAVVDADRAKLEEVFAEPTGGYKPGDEAFFRSVALPQSCAIPVYLDLAFADGAMMSWTDIVQTMGTRIG